ncbi:hypothetical protein [Candidatus Palauibacter sp.]|uniref:hypothetical protein n=1 Tax=Candidatus Palauibacter sp. TaxID=3101350 RepID=UPI003B01CA55
MRAGSAGPARVAIASTSRSTASSVARPDARGEIAASSASHTMDASGTPKRSRRASISRSACSRKS